MKNDRDLTLERYKEENDIEMKEPQKKEYVTLSSLYSTHLHSFVNYNSKVSSGFESPKKPTVSVKKNNSIDTNLTIDDDHINTDVDNDNECKYISNVFRRRIPSTKSKKEQSADLFYCSFFCDYYITNHNY